MKIGLIGYEANVAHRVGSNQYAFELMKALFRLDKENKYLVFLPSPPRADLPPERENWRYEICGPAKFWNWWGLPRAINKSRRQLDLVFNPGHYAPWVKEIPLVVSVMDLGFLRFPHQFRRLDYWQLKYWTSLSVKRAVLVLAISEFTRQDLIRTYELGPQKVVATPLGYDKNRFQPDISPQKVAAVCRKYKLEDKYLLTLSTLKPSKNVLGLLEAYSLLVAAKPDLPRLVIAGKKGWLYEDIFRRVKQLGLTRSVVFTGFVADEEVPALMKGAELFVLPSFWEGFGIPVLEAMAMGTPVVVARVASLPEVVGEAGILVNPSSIESIAEGIERGLAKRSKLAQSSLLQAKKFSWEKCARQTQSALERAINLPPTNRSR